MLKNIFGSDLLKNQVTVYCTPIGFDVYEREVAYCQYAINNVEEHLADDWKKELNNFIEQRNKNIMSNQQFF
jgi:endonuclease YncB( thermonuclease family)